MPKMSASTYFVERYKLETMLDHIQKFRITDLLLAPPILVAMSKNNKLQTRQVDLSSVKRVICGAAPLGLETMESCDRMWHGSCRIRQVWGMSEAPAISLGWDELDTSTKISTAVGELLPGQEAKLMQDNGEERLDMHPGELWIRGPNIMTSYWKNPKATADTVTSDGWLKTGDIARVDKNGKWYIVDREKELIKVRGAQVAPAELEALLLEHPQVVDAAVIGIKTIDGDEVPKAFIVARDERMVSSSKIQDFVQARVVKQKRLDGGVVFVKKIPKTAAGKILRRLLKDEGPQQTLKLQSRL
jgi:4-coumarate--CoA ligase